MFVRHIRKFRSTAEMQAAISSGAIAAPYIAFESSSNVMNMTIPADKEPASIDYQQESDEPVWNSPQLVPNMYTADPSNGEYTDASGKFDIYYGEDAMEGWKYIDSLYFYLNSQYLEGWGSTAEFIENNTADGSNTPRVFITEKSALDAAVEYWSNLTGYSESKTLSYLVYEVMNENKELRYNDVGGNTCTWPFGFSDGTETSFWGEDIEYLNDDAQSLEGYYMESNNNEGETPEFYILVAYQKEEDEPLRASKDNILRAPVDYESYFKVYKAGIFRAYDYSEEEDDTPDASAWYEDIDWLSSDEYDEHGQKVVDYTLFGPDASMSVEEGLYDIYIKNWDKMWHAVDTQEPCHMSLVVNPTIVSNSADEYILSGGRVVDPMIGEDGQTYSMQFYDCSIGANDEFFLVTYDTDNNTWSTEEEYICIGPFTGESIDSIEVEWNTNSGFNNPPTSVVVTPMSVTPDSSTDASVYSTAEITGWATTGQEWDDENYNHHTEYAATLFMTNNDASVNFIQFGMCPLTDFDTSTGIPEGFNSLDDYYEDVCSGSYYDISAIFNGSTEAYWDATGYLVYDDYDITINGYAWRVVLRYVNGEVNQTEDEWGNPTEEFIVHSAKPWINLGDVPMPEPEVMFENFSDDSNGTTTFDAFLNEQAAEAGYYYKAGRTSDNDWSNIMSQDMTASWDEYIQNNCLDNDVYTGTEDNQDSITVTYPTNEYDTGYIVVAMFDDQDNYITYFEVGQWFWPSM